MYPFHANISGFKIMFPVLLWVVRNWWWIKTMYPRNKTILYIDSYAAISYANLVVDQDNDNIIILFAVLLNFETMSPSMFFLLPKLSSKFTVS